MRMGPGRRLAPWGLFTACLLLVACSSAVPRASQAGPRASPTPAPPTTTPSTPPIAATSPAGGGTPSTPPGENLVEPFPGIEAFHDPTTIDNRWFPLVPGSRWIWDGSAADDHGQRVNRRVVFTVTDLVKVIDGITTVVTQDIDYTGGVLDELEIALYAQADDGTVWHLGQYPEEYDGGQIENTPAWVHGIQQAAAGITMKAEPEPRTPSYSQGWGPAVGWTDRATVSEVNAETCVPSGCYTGVLVVDEFNRDQPDAHQLKYYSPGVGCVRVGWTGAGELQREELELVSVSRLTTEELAALRGDVLAMDLRASEYSPDVWGRIAPITAP